MKTTLPPLKYSTPSELDVTTLRNYVPPEQTLEAGNKNWADAKSCFYRFADHHIFAEACARRKPTDVEIKLPEARLTDAQHDALLTYDTAGFCGVDLDDEDAEIVAGMNIQTFYRYNSITHSRHRHGMAIVMNDELLIVF